MQNIDPITPRKWGTSMFFPARTIVLSGSLLHNIIFTCPPLRLTGGAFPVQQYQPFGEFTPSRTPGRQPTGRPWAVYDSSRRRA